MSETTRPDRARGMSAGVFGDMGGLLGIFGPEQIMPAQMPARRSAELDGERRLMLAILEDAVDVLGKYAGATDVRRRGLYHDALRWIEDDDAAWIYSYVRICEHLGLDADAARDALRRRGWMPAVPLGQHVAGTRTLVTSRALTR